MPFMDAPAALRSLLASPSLPFFSFLFRFCDFLFFLLSAPLLQPNLPLPFPPLSISEFLFLLFILFTWAFEWESLPFPHQQAPSVSVVTLIMSKWRRVGLFVNWSGGEKNV